MAVNPAPTRGVVLDGVGVQGRALRVSAHPEFGLVVLSVWQDERCVATVRIAESDVPDLVRALAESLLAAPSEMRATG